MCVRVVCVYLCSCSCMYMVKAVAQQIMLHERSMIAWMRTKLISVMLELPWKLAVLNFYFPNGIKRNCVVIAVGVNIKAGDLSVLFCYTPHPFNLSFLSPNVAFFFSSWNCTFCAVLFWKSHNPEWNWFLIWSLEANIKLKKRCINKENMWCMSQQTILNVECSCEGVCGVGWRLCLVNSSQLISLHNMGLVFTEASQGTPASTTPWHLQDTPPLCYC